MPPTAALAITVIAPGVKQVTVGERAMSQAYLLDHPDGPVAFDAGVSGTGEAVLDAAEVPLSRVVLSHSHIDHRGGANELGAPVFRLDPAAAEFGSRHPVSGNVRCRASARGRHPAP